MQRNSLEIESAAAAPEVRGQRARTCTFSEFDHAKNVLGALGQEREAHLFCDWVASDDVSGRRSNFSSSNSRLSRPELDRDSRSAERLSNFTAPDIKLARPSAISESRFTYMKAMIARVQLESKRARAAEPLWSRVSGDPCPVTDILFLLGGVLMVAVCQWYGLLQFREEASGGYVMLYGLVVAVSLMCRGVRPVIVFISLLAVLSCCGYIKKQHLLSGFARDGAWVPQLMLINIKAIKDSGLLNSLLEFLLVRRRSTWLATYLQIYLSTIVLAAILGAGPTIAISAPIVTRWAEQQDVGLKPVLWILAVSASVGNVMFLTSAPISMSIMEITCEHDPLPFFNVQLQTPLACALGIPLGIYAFFAPQYMPKKVVALERDSAGSGDFADDEAFLPAKCFYCLDFVVEEMSIVLNKTPREVGIRREDGVCIVRICRSQSRDACARRASITNPRAQALNADVWREMSRRNEIDNWVFQAGDVLTVRCSNAGIVAMRSHSGVFALEGLRCHVKLGGRRHLRRLFECVVCEGSSIVGATVNQLQGWPDFSAGLDEEAPGDFSFLDAHRGYPLGAYRREARKQSETGLSGFVTRSLSSSQDRILPGDVLLVDAFEAFARLDSTSSNFSVVALVPDSQAPRHGRLVDTLRGLAAIGFLVIVVILAQQQMLPLVVGCLVSAIVLCLIKALVIQQVMDVLNWPLFLVVGSAGGVSAAIRATGVDYAIGMLLRGYEYNSRCVLLVLLGQVFGNVLSPVAAGLIVAPIATEVLASRSEDGGGCNQYIGVLVIMSCNLVLFTPYGAPSNAVICSLGGFSTGSFMLYGGIASIITVVALLVWADATGLIA